MSFISISNGFLDDPKLSKEQKDNLIKRYNKIQKLCCKGWSLPLPKLLPVIYIKNKLI